MGTRCRTAAGSVERLGTCTAGSQGTCAEFCSALEEAVLGRCDGRSSGGHDFQRLLTSLFVGLARPCRPPTFSSCSKPCMICKAACECLIRMSFFVARLRWNTVAHLGFPQHAVHCTDATSFSCHRTQPPPRCFLMALLCVCSLHGRARA